MSAAVLAGGLRKSYGPTKALDGIDLAIPEGSVFGLLGPNGAGKTTAVRILTTLLRADAGHAEVLGHDVGRDAAVIRTLIGLTGQFAAVDDLLTGRENLRLVGELYHLPKKVVAQRADELLERFDLTDAADRILRTYSGGMRRRLDLAASLVNRPRLLFLDEPTTGLDPRSRIGLWGIIEELVREGTTLLLTSQYLEEVDRLADRIAVIDFGRIIAEGTSDDLKGQVGGELVEVRVAPDQLDKAEAVLTGLGCEAVTRSGDNGTLSLPAAAGGVRLVADAARVLADAHIEVRDLGLRRPTLDDVFLALTGHAAAAGTGSQDGSPRRGRRARRARTRRVA